MLTINGQLTGSDRPMLTSDGTNLYITAAQFSISPSDYVGTESWVISDTAGQGGGLYNGGTLTVTANQLTPHQGEFTVAAGGNGKTYYASDYSSGGQILLALQTYDKATNTFGPISTLSLGNIDQGGAYTVQQKGTSLLLDAVDNRIANIVYANGFLYGVSDMKPIGSSVPWSTGSRSTSAIPTRRPWSRKATFPGPRSAPTLRHSTAPLPSTRRVMSSSISPPAAQQLSVGLLCLPRCHRSDRLLQRAHCVPGEHRLLSTQATAPACSAGASIPRRPWIRTTPIRSGFRTNMSPTAGGRPRSRRSRSRPGHRATSIAASGAGITNGSGDLNAGKVITLSVNFSAAVTVNTTGGTPTLTLNDGGAATFVGGSGTTALTFSYTVAAGQNTPDLIVSAFNLNGATVKDGAGNVADLSGATNNNPAGTLQIDTLLPSVSSIATSGTGITNGSGNLGVGQAVTLTVNMSEAVTVNTTGGSPTLTLNDGGTATFVGGSGTTALTFSYTVAAGQNTPDLIVSAFNLNGATVKDGAGNVANLSAATNNNPAGTLQISTTATAISSIAAPAPESGGSGDLNAGQAVTLTVNMSAAVTVNTTGGTPTLTLNDGGAATFVGGSGTTALTFSYTVAAGQNTPDLIVSAFNLNGATVKDAAGNVANLSGATNNNPAGTLQIDTIAPVPVFNQEPPPVTSSSTAVFAFTTSNSETNGVSYAYKLDSATTWTAVSGNTLSLSGLANGFTHDLGPGDRRSGQRLRCREL